MRHLLTIIASAVLIFFYVNTSYSSQIIETNIVKMTKNSGDIVRVMCKSVESGFEGMEVRGAPKAKGVQPKTIATRVYTMEILEVLKGKTYKVGETTTIKQFSSFIGKDGKPLRASISQPAFCSEGEEKILFLRQKRSKYGFVTTSGLSQGVFDVKDGEVKNKFMNSYTFKGVPKEKPGVSKALNAGKVDVTKPPKAMKTKDFEDMVKLLVSTETDSSEEVKLDKGNDVKEEEEKGKNLSDEGEAKELGSEQGGKKEGDTK